MLPQTTISAQAASQQHIVTTDKATGIQGTGSTKTTISVREASHGHVVATDERTGLQARGTNRPIALITLAEKLEVELLSESGQSCE